MTEHKLENPLLHWPSANPGASTSSKQQLGNYLPFPTVRGVATYVAPRVLSSSWISHSIYGGRFLYSLRNQFPLQRVRLWQRLQRQRFRVKRFGWFWQFGWRGGVRWRGSGRICGGHRRRRTNEFPTISGCR